MPFSILRKMDEDIKKDIKKNIKKEEKMSDKCVKELQNLEKCNNENKDCTDIFNLWIKCNEQPILERKS